MQMRLYSNIESFGSGEQARHPGLLERGIAFQLNMLIAAYIINLPQRSQGARV